MLLLPEQICTPGVDFVFFNLIAEALRCFVCVFVLAF